MRILVLIAFLLSPLIYAAEAPFSANDLAFLLPLDENNNNLPKQPITVGDAQFKIVSSKVLHNILATAQNHKVFLNADLRNPARWYLVGFRYSPCIQFAGKDLPCTEQIRFVFQPHDSERKTPGGGFDDYALHVIYNFAQGKTAQHTPRLASFNKLKLAANGATLDSPLQVHPILNSPAAPAYLAMIKTEIIDKHVAIRNPDNVTFMGLEAVKDNTGAISADSDRWIFMHGVVNTRGEWSLTNLPIGVPIKTETLRLTEDEMSLESSLGKNLPKITLMRHEPNYLETSMKIFDGSRTNDHNVDCASCHIADRMVFVPGLALETPKERTAYLEKIYPMIKDRARVSEILIDTYLHAGMKATEVPLPRIFGYLDAAPAISQRMVVDNALAVESANQLLKLQVTPQCEGKPKRIKLLECLVFDNYTATLNECMAKACK